MGLTGGALKKHKTTGRSGRGWVGLRTGGCISYTFPAHGFYYPQQFCERNGAPFGFFVNLKNNLANIYASAPEQFVGP